MELSHPDLIPDCGEMVQLKQLERSLETSIAEGYLSGSEKTIDSYLDESIPIDSAASSKLHDMLVRVASNTVSHRGEPSPVLVSALVRLCPCLINEDQLRVWFDMLVPLALDSGGRENTLVTRSREFLECVLTGDFYAEELQKQYEQNSLKFFEWLVDIYVGKGRLVISTIPAGKDATATDEYWTEERRRFVRFNCRSLIVEHAAKDPAGAFTVLNKYLLEPKHRLDILQVVSEFVATWQTAKLFKVYDTPLFESLLNCLEYDKPAPALSAASTTLAMLLPHVCDKLVPILPRVLACFGRICSWQPPNESPVAHQPSSPPKNGWTVLYEVAPEKVDVDKIPNQNLEELVAGDGSDAESEPEQAPPTYAIDIAPLFTFLYGLFPANVINFCRQCDEYLSKREYTRRFSDFWSRFMVRQRAEQIANQFLLHPLVLSQNSDQEIAGSDARWQSFHSTSSLAIFCAGLRVPDVSLVVSDQEKALDVLLEEHQRRFQEATARINMVAPVLDTHKIGEPASPTQQHSPKQDQPQAAVNMWASFNRSRSASAGATSLTSSGLQPSALRMNAAVIDREKDTLASAPQSPGLVAKPSPYLHPSVFKPGVGSSQADPSAGITAFYQRELLLNKNELDFANFCRYISERRVVRLQKQVRNLSMVQLRNEDLVRKTKQLSQKLETFEDQAEKSQRSARVILRERTAYASTLIEKNRDFRSRIQVLEDQIQELQEHLGRAQTERDTAIGEAADNSARVSALEMAQSGLNQRYDEATTKLKDISENMKEVGREQQADPIDRTVPYSRELEEARLEIQGLREDKERAASDYEREIASLRSELTRLATPQPPQTPSNVAGQRDEEIAQLRSSRDQLAQQCAALETELRARKVHEEERMNELRMALMSARPFNAESGLSNEPRFKGRGGAQGTVRW